LQPIPIGHRQIKDGDRGVEIRRYTQRLTPACCQQNGKPCIGQQGSQDVTYGRVVIDDESATP
jgi:hypothetical protein